LDLDGKLLYSTFLGGEGPDIGSAIAVGPATPCFVTGIHTSCRCSSHTRAPDPQPAGVPDPVEGSQDAFVAKLNPSQAGQSSRCMPPSWAATCDDSGEGIAVDGQGNAWVTGLAGSASINFPVKNPIQPDQPGADAFVSKLKRHRNAASVLDLPGRQRFGGVRPRHRRRRQRRCLRDRPHQLDQFPITPGAYDMTCSCPERRPVERLRHQDTSQGKLAYSTYLGGNKKYQQARAIAVDTLGDARAWRHRLGRLPGHAWCPGHPLRDRLHRYL
jgi:hypothetical protein